MTKASLFLCVVFGLCAIDPGNGSKLNTVFQWGHLEYEYENLSARQADLDNRVFIPEMAAPMDVDVYYSHSRKGKDKVFVTIPKFGPGVPATFATVTDKKYNNNPIIRPYPSWDWHRNLNQCKPNRMVSVFRVKVDECQRLWVLDSGRLAAGLSSKEQLCPPQILVFDLKTDQLIHRYEIPSDQIESRSIMVNLAVDVRDAHGTCSDTFVYAADCRAYSIIVYDVKHNVSWRISDKTMYPYPNYGTYSIMGDSYELMDGILGMALAPYKRGEERILFYHAMSSPTENYVKTSDLKNKALFVNESQSYPEIFHTYRGERRTQAGSEATDKDGIMYFGLMSDVTIDCWNTKTPYGPGTMEVIARNKQTLQFAGGVKVITNRKGIEELWVLTSSFQRVAARTVNISETNFRILEGKVHDLTYGTICRGRHIRVGG